MKRRSGNGASLILPEKGLRKDLNERAQVALRSKFRFDLLGQFGEALLVGLFWSDWVESQS